MDEFETHYTKMAEHGRLAAEALRNGSRPFGMPDHAAEALAAYLDGMADGMERMWGLAKAALPTTAAFHLDENDEIPEEFLLASKRSDEE